VTIDFNKIIGETIVSIENKTDELKFICLSGNTYTMYHDQDCCESVSIDDIVGDLNDLIGEPVLKASEDTNRNEPKRSEYDESFTWTFYNISTIKGHVTIKWYGTSNGYYSESVSFKTNIQINEDTLKVLIIEKMSTSNKYLGCIPTKIKYDVDTYESKIDITFNIASYNLSDHITITLEEYIAKERDIKINNLLS